jgi:hypothetical protein
VKPLGALLAVGIPSSSRMPPVIVQVNGRHLPGLRCNPGPDGTHDNVHVGIGSKWIATELVRGGAPAATWRFDVRHIVLSDG